MNPSAKHVIECLKRSRLYRDFATAFRDAVGLPLALTPPETWSLPLHEDKNEGPFCRVMAEANGTCAACLRQYDDLRQKATHDVATATCAFGLCDSAVPVKVGNQLVGFLHTGQVFTKQPTAADFDRTMRTLDRWGAAGKASELRTAYFAGKVLPPKQYEAILRLLKVFAEQLDAVGNQILVADESAEMPPITRVKEFITQRMTDDIRLADCARVAHMSPFYFCKTFKRATGLNFTSYLARLRTEKAKDCLLNPHLRVSEVAFAVGFQSLSQFNRTFKRFTGRSPTAYRFRLPASTLRHNGVTLADDQSHRPSGFSHADRESHRGNSHMPPWPIAAAS